MRELEFEAGAYRLCLGARTKLMGVLNVTPDSFSDGGRWLDPALAEEKALALQDEGADILDIGGESTRPGAKPVTAREEIRRLLPVLKRLAQKIKIPVSVDTSKHDVALAALDQGAQIVNDVTALGDKRMARTAARYGASVVLMHMQGTPRTMQKAPAYRDVVKEVALYLKRAVGRALDAGIPKRRLLVDPGFGFGKTVEHNLELLGRLDEFAALGLPVLAGLSRKSFLGHVLGAPAQERLTASLAAGAAAIERGAHVLRVHDVTPHRQMAMVVDLARTRAIRRKTQR